MDQRLQFLSSYQKEEMSLSDLCREFGVSRPTEYRWINRYKEAGPEGLLDLSSKPHGCSHATSETAENAIPALRSKHPSWGARKLKARLEKLQPRASWPAASTLGNILRRAGLTNPKQKETKNRPVLGAVLRRDRSEPVVVHGFQGLLQHGRWYAVRSFDDHRCVQPLSHPLPDRPAHGPRSSGRGL